MSEKAPVVAKSDVEAQPIWERGADGMPDPEKKPGDPAKEPFSLGPIPVEAFLTSMFMPIPLVWALHPLKWYNSRTFKLLWTYAAAFLYHHFLAATLGDLDAPEGHIVNKWHFLTAILVNRLVLELNFYPMKFKAQIMGAHKNLRTNMAIYKQMDGDGVQQADSPAIVMVEDGATGQFNRANRSLTHFTEFAPAIVVLMLVARDAFPSAVFILSVVYAYGRVIHQTGEAESYGAHGAGFGLTFNVHFLLEGLCAVAFLKSSGCEAAWLGLGPQTDHPFGELQLGETDEDDGTDASPLVAIAVIVVFFAWLRFGYPKIQKRGSFP